MATVSLALLLLRSVSATVAGVGAGALVLLCVVAAVRHPFVGDVDPNLVVLVCWSTIALGSSLAAVLGAQTSPPAGCRTVFLPGTVVTLLVPLGGAVVWAVAVALTPGAARIGWAMNRDSANNLMLARFLIEDGGVDPRHQSNPAFLAQAVFAVAFPSGRPVVPSHLLVAAAITWAAALVAAATLMTLFVLRASRSRGVPVLAALTGLGTYSWFVAGQMFSFGFLNVSIVLLLLLAALLVAVDPYAAPWQVLVVQLLLGTLMLANWAPLVVLPVALAAMRLLTGPGRRLPTASDRWGVVAMVLAVGQLAAYILTVVLPDLRSDGGNLTQGGWMFPVSPITWIIASGWTTLVAFGRIRRSAHHRGPVSSCRVEYVAVAATSALSLTVILFLALNHVSGTPLWSYYPQKVAWITTIVDLVLLAALCGPSSDSGAGPRVGFDTSPPAHSRVSLQRRTFAGLAWVVIGVALLVSAAPSVQGPGVGGVVPLVRMLRGGDYPAPRRRR